MNFTKWISVLILLLNLSFISYGQETTSRLSGFTIPVADSTLNIIYNPKGGPLEGMDKISGIVYMFNDYQWNVGDIELKNNNGIWKGRFDVPKNCAFVAFKFVVDGMDNIAVSDNNDDKGFVYITCDRNKSRLPGGTLAWGIFRKPSLGKGVSGYYQKFNILDEALEMWVTKEMEAYPLNITKYFDSFMAMVKLRTGDNFDKAAKKFISNYLSNPNLQEFQYLQVVNIYRFELKDKVKADSLEQVMLTKYPQGGMARFKKYNEVYSMPLDEHKVIATEQFMRDFPFQKWAANSDFSYQKFIYLNTYRNLASAYFASGQNDKLIALIPDMDFVTLNDVYHWNIDRAFKLKLLSQDKIYIISEALIKEMVKKVKDKSYMDGIRFSPKQADEHAQNELDGKLSTHIVLLNKMEKYSDALNYIEYLSDKGKYSNAEVNEAHVNSFEKTGREVDALSVIEMGLKTNAVTSMMFDRLKTIYRSKNGSDVGYEKYVESLKSAEDVKKLQEHIKSELVKVKVDPFLLPAMNMTTVNSSDWKGKIVVLDFWATWCFPCKMSFTGMQLAVDRYAKDPDVLFYFIATMERSKEYKSEIKEYIKKSGYHFNVLFDGVNKQTKENNLVFSTFVPIFKSSAIPRKVIMKDGYMRYTAEGYGGSPSKLADEISYVIEMLKAED